MDDFALKEIASSAIEHAVEKAETYRLLNDPEQAESICLDVLKIRPNHQQTLRNIVLALTDQFGQTASKIKEAKTHAMQLSDEYERHYFCGLVAEREARALLRQRFFEPSCAWLGFRDAMDFYERAEAIRPEGNDDALLRWNSCVRSIRRHRLARPERSRELPLE